MAYQILVVSPDDTERRQIEQVLSEAGYGVCTATTFADGKRLLAMRKPDLLITEERLGDFNGLHLVLRGRFVDPSMAAIVTSTQHDRVVERDAHAMHAVYVVQPKDPSEWLRECRRELQAHQVSSPAGGTSQVH